VRHRRDRNEWRWPYALGGLPLGYGTHRVVIPASQRDGRPGLRESLRRGETESGRRACDQRDLSFE
jgi:hypothetical protein